MKRKIFGILLLSSLSLAAGAQRQWTLGECIADAQQNNIRLQQSKLQSKGAEITLQDAKNSRLPNLGASMSGSFGFGRGVNDAYKYENKTQFSSNVGISSSMALFNGFRIKHNIEASKLDLEASLHDIASVSENISLTIMSLYLQTLFTIEIVDMGYRQVAISEELVKSNEAKLDAGKISESVLYESRSQLARDQYSLVGYQSDYRLALLDLMQTMNMEPNPQFGIRKPVLDEVALEMMNRMGTAREVYSASVDYRPGILAANSRLTSYEKKVLIAKALRYPSISLSAGYNNGYYYSFQDASGTPSFLKQVKNKGGENIGVNISIPIFERGTIKSRIQSASLSVNSQQLAVDEAKQSLRKEIEQASEKAQTSYEKYQSAMKSAETSSIVFGHEQKKLAAGTNTLFDYNNAKTQMERSQTEVLQAKYDYLFRCKILGFYLGEPIDFVY